MPTAEQNEQIVRNFFKVLSTGELENIRKTLHADASWTPMVTDSALVNRLPAVRISSSVRPSTSSIHKPIRSPIRSAP